MQCQKQNTKTCCAGVSCSSPLQHSACCPVAVKGTGAEWSGGLLGSITAGCTTGDERCIHSSVSLRWCGSQEGGSTAQLPAAVLGWCRIRSSPQILFRICSLLGGERRGGHQPELFMCTFAGSSCSLGKKGMKSLHSGFGLQGALSLCAHCVHASEQKGMGYVALNC